MSSIFFHLYIFCFFLSRCTHTRRTVHETNLNTCSLFSLFFLATVIPRSFVSFMVPGCSRLGFCQIYPSIVCIETCRVWHQPAKGWGILRHTIWSGLPLRRHVFMSEVAVKERFICLCWYASDVYTYPVFNVDEQSALIYHAVYVVNLNLGYPNIDPVQDVNQNWWTRIRITRSDYRETDLHRIVEQQFTYFSNRLIGAFWMALQVSHSMFYWA